MGVGGTRGPPAHFQFCFEVYGNLQNASASAKAQLDGGADGARLKDFGRHWSAVSSALQNDAS